MRFAPLEPYTVVSHPNRDTKPLQFFFLLLSSSWPIRHTTMIPFVTAAVVMCCEGNCHCTVICLLPGRHRRRLDEEGLLDGATVLRE